MLGRFFLHVDPRALKIQFCYVFKFQMKGGEEQPGAGRYFSWYRCVAARTHVHQKDITPLSGFKPTVLFCFARGKQNVKPRSRLGGFTFVTVHFSWECSGLAWAGARESALWGLAPRSATASPRPRVQGLSRLRCGADCRWHASLESPVSDTRWQRCRTIYFSNDRERLFFFFLFGKCVLLFPFLSALPTHWWSLFTPFPFETSAAYSIFHLQKKKSRWA